MPPQILREYQQRALQETLAAWRDGARSVLLVAPTGSGKTSTFGSLTASLNAAGRNVLINVHRRELATQAATRLHEFGVPFGYIMANEPTRPNARVQIASVQTLVRRKMPPADVVICDEAHLSTARTWQTILDNYPRARILGVTATPFRLSGKPLAGAYDRLVVASTPRELRELGFLCDFRGFSYKSPDLSGVKTTGGDYNERQSAEAMSQGTIVDSVVEEWIKHARDLSTVVFAVTVEHSKQLTAKFRAAGIAAEHIDGTMPKLQRDSVLKRLERGQIQVLCNVGIAVEGLDVPRLKCCVLARPTKSLARYIQMVGRVRRPWNGQVARIHDHSFCITQHGLPDDERDYTLDAKPETPPSLTTCSECLALYSGPSCPACGKEPEPKPQGERELNTIADAEMVEFTSESENPDLRKPVDIKWNAPGRTIEGRLLKRWEETETWGKRKRYLIRADKRDYSVPGTTHLDGLMSRVRVTDLIRVSYEGDLDLGGGRSKKLFKVEVDDGCP